MNAAELPTHVLDLAWRIGCVWLVVAVAARWLQRRGSAQLRHALWLGVLLAPLVPPFAAGARTVAPWLASSVGRDGEASGAATGDEALPPGDGGADTGAGALIANGGRAASSRERRVPAWWRWGAPLWASAVALLAMREWVRWRRRAAWARAAAPAPAWALAQLAAAAQRMGVAPPTLRISDAFASPGIVGLTSPTLLLPASLFDDDPSTVGTDAANPTGSALLAPIFVHELFHLRRRDPWIAALATTLRTLFCFHPGVWNAAARLARERELAVDEAVVFNGAIPAMDYARSLLHVAATASRRGAADPAIALSVPAKSLAERIELLLGAQRSRRRAPSQIVAGFVTLAVVACGAASSTQTDDRRAGAAGDRARAVSTIADLVAASGVELPQISEGGIALDHGGTSMVIVVRADGTIAPPTALALPDDGHGFEAGPPFAADGSAMEGLLVTQEAPARIQMVLRSGPTTTHWNAAVDGKHATDFAELDALLASALARAPDTPQVVTYAFGKPTFGPIALVIAHVQHAFPRAFLVYGGVPMDMEQGEQVRATLAAATLSEDHAGDILIVGDVHASSASHGQVMQELATRRFGRFAFVARRGDELVKVKQYLPQDGGVAKK